MWKSVACFSCQSLFDHIDDVAEDGTDNAEVCIAEGGVGKAKVAEDRHQEYGQEGNQDAVGHGAEHCTAEAAGGVTEDTSRSAAEEVGYDARQDDGQGIYGAVHSPQSFQQLPPSFTTVDVHHPLFTVIIIRSKIRHNKNECLQDYSCKHSFFMVVAIRQYSIGKGHRARYISLSGGFLGGA